MKRTLWVLLVLLGIACFAGGRMLPPVKKTGAPAEEESESGEILQDKGLHKEILEHTLGWQRDWNAKSHREGLRFFLQFLGIALAGFAGLALAFPFPGLSLRRGVLCIVAFSWILGGVYFSGKAAIQFFRGKRMKMAFEKPRYISFFKKVKERIPGGARVLVVIENATPFHAAITQNWPAFFYQASYLLYPRKLYFDRNYPTKKRFAWKRVVELNIDWILLITDENIFECKKVSDLSGGTGRDNPQEKG